MVSAEHTLLVDVSAEFHFNFVRNRRSVSANVSYGDISLGAITLGFLFFCQLISMLRLEKAVYINRK